MGLSPLAPLLLPENGTVPFHAPSGSHAAIVVVHGINEHSGRYGRLADDLNRRGYAVYAMDLRGHGRSDGDRALIHSFDEYLDDLEILLARVAARQPGKPLFSVGA